MFMEKIYGAWMAETQREKAEKILEEIGLQNIEGKKILDVGSGPGFLGEMLRKRTRKCFAVSCDIDLENLKKAGGLKVLASGGFLPFKKAFDFVFCIDAIHLLGAKRAGKELAAALNGSGALVVSAFCNKYNSGAKMKELEDSSGGLKVEKRFLVETEKESDAVIFGYFQDSE